MCAAIFPWLNPAILIEEAGKISLDLRKAKGTFTLQWINIDTGELGESATISNRSSVTPEKRL